MFKGVFRGRNVVCAALAVVATAWCGIAAAQEVKHYRFAYDQPNTTGYGVAGNLFADKLKELSKGTILIDQYPGAQLGQEPQVLQLVKAGDVEFCISSSANAATLTPQAGVMSLHYLFRSEDHLIKALGDAKVNAILPGWIDTELTQSARAQVPGLNDKVLARAPAQRWGNPEDFAGIAVFLAAPASNFVTGMAIPVDGGYSIMA